VGFGPTTKVVGTEWSGNYRHMVQNEQRGVENASPFSRQR